MPCAGGSWRESEAGSTGTLGGLVLSGAVADALRAGGGSVGAGAARSVDGAQLSQRPRSHAALRRPLGAGVPRHHLLIHPVLGWIALGGAVALFVCAVSNDLATRKKLAEASGASARALNAADAAIRNADAIAAMGMLPSLLRRWQEAGARGQHLLAAATDASGSISAFAKVTRFGLQVAWG